MRLLSCGALAALSCVTVHAWGAEVYGGGGTTGFEVGLAQTFTNGFAARIEANNLSITRAFNTSGVDYDAKVKFSNVGVYLDAFVGSSLRLTGGALVGNRKIHGVARSVGNTIDLNGVRYVLAAGDSLDFDAKFPNVTPYLGVGWGHHQDAAGLHFYADAGVAIGRPEVKLTPSASLLAKVNPTDLAAEQNTAQDKADSLRFFPVLKLGIRYTF
jgi:hypothetical protein